MAGKSLNATSKEVEHHRHVNSFQCTECGRETGGYENNSN